jgi:hypothetical protein
MPKGFDWQLAVIAACAVGILLSVIAFCVVHGKKKK